MTRIHEKSYQSPEKQSNRLCYHEIPRLGIPLKPFYPHSSRPEKLSCNDGIGPLFRSQRVREGPFQIPFPHPCARKRLRGFSTKKKVNI